MLPEQWDDLEAWAKNLKGPGVLVLPQPLLKAGGSKTDRTLVDFQESDRFGAIFERALGGDDPHDILILTGDIHTGRLSSARDRRPPGRDLRARRLARLARHARGCRRGATSRRALPDKLIINRRIVEDHRAHPADADRRQQRRADQDRARPQRPLSLHAAAVARAAVRRHRQADLRPQARQGRPTAPRPDRTSSSAEEEQVLRHSQTDTQNPDVVDWSDRYGDADNTHVLHATRSPT